MTAASAGVLDTSVFIARESGRPLDTALIPDEVATTVITLAELNVGVLAAQTADIRAQRLATLDTVADMTALPVDDDAARMWHECGSTSPRPSAVSASTISGSRRSPPRKTCPWLLRTTTSTH